MSTSSSEGYVRVGKVKDAHGIRGELFVVFFGGQSGAELDEWIEELEDLRLVIEHGNPDAKTFPIKSARVHKNGMIVKCHDIKDRNIAETLKGRIVEIPEALLISEPGETVYLREVLGFTVITKANGPVGTIEAFSSNTVQDLLIVKTKSGPFEIPFVKQFVESIDYEAKTITMDLPYGLLGEDLGEDVVESDADSADESDDESES